MTGQEIIGLVAVCLTLLSVVLTTIYIGTYHLRRYDAHSWYRKRIFELQNDLNALRKCYEHHEVDRHERHKGCD
jgi:hypothetical protein